MFIIYKHGKSIIHTKDPPSPYNLEFSKTVKKRKIEKIRFNYL